MYISVYSFLYFNGIVFLRTAPSMIFLEGMWDTPLPSTNTWGSLASSLASYLAFLLTNSAAYFLPAWICVFLSALSDVKYVALLPLHPVISARNDFIFSICVTIVDVSSHAASNNHNCILCFSVELQLSVSIPLEYQNFLMLAKCEISWHPTQLCWERGLLFHLGTFCILYSASYNCTHFSAYIFEFISETVP